MVFLNRKITFLFFLKQKWHLIILIVSLIFNILIWLWLWWQVKPTDQLIPLSYNIYFGIDYLGNWQQIFLGPILGLGVILVNYFFAYLIFLKDKFISYWLIVIAAITQILLLTYYIILILNYY